MPAMAAGLEWHFTECVKTDMVWIMAAQLEFQSIPSTIARDIIMTKTCFVYVRQRAPSIASLGFNVAGLFNVGCGSMACSQT